MKKVLFLSAVYCFLTAINCMAGSFQYETKVTQVMSYAGNSSYPYNDCLVYFETESPSSCTSKNRGVIKADTSVGKMMCSMALTAAVSGKTVTVASEDQCFSRHSAPILRFISVHSQ